MNVIVNILDPLCGASQEDLLCGDFDDSAGPYRKEEWEVGTDVTPELCSKWVDRVTKELYMLVMYEKGKQECFFTTIDYFNAAKAKMLI